MLVEHPASPTRRDHDPDDASTTTITTRILLSVGSLKLFVSLWPAHTDEHEEQHEVHDGADDDVQPDPGDARRGIDAGLLQESQVEGHATDVRRRDPVHERRRHLRFHRGDERQWLGMPPANPTAAAT